MWSSISQNFRLFSAILAKMTRPLMPHVLIKYAHVLICISAGEGSQHFSAFYFGSMRKYHIFTSMRKYHIFGCGIYACYQKCGIYACYQKCGIYACYHKINVVFTHATKTWYMLPKMWYLCMLEKMWYLCVLPKMWYLRMLEKCGIYACYQKRSCIILPACLYRSMPISKPYKEVKGAHPHNSGQLDFS